ncbi:MAG: sugar phosphate nucleotidyltransferase [Candidatus Bathyarchaeia archaeon]|nr:NTP transferase domain-containing protein [Candidatus Bathyarchaeota archaeon]
MRAVILAAGEGQRLRPLTYTRPKHMIPVGGKPVLEHVINALKASGIEDILIVVNYMADVIKEYFGDGSKYGVKIKYVYQEKISGTAGAIFSAREYVNEPFLAINGDTLFSPDAIKLVIDKFCEESSDAVLAAVRISDPREFGVLKVKDGELIDIVEKPSKEVTGSLVNAGIYVFPTDIFSYIERTKLSERGELEITESIRLLLSENRRVSVVEISGESWLDIGRPWDLLEANARILAQIKQSILGDVEEGAHIKGPVFISEGALIRSGSYIEGPVFIGCGSDIGPNCYIRPYTSIGKNVRIGNACEIKNSILMDNVHVGHLSYIGDSIIGENCNLGAGSISANLRFDKKTVKMRVKGEVVDTGRVKLGVIMGDNVLTGVGALFMPGVTIGCNCWIGPNVIVYEDVPSNTILILEQQIRRKSIQ